MIVSTGEIPWGRNPICALIALNTSKEFSVTFSHFLTFVYNFPIYKIGAYICVCLIIRITLKDSYHHSPCPLYNPINEELAIWSDLSKVTQLLNVISREAGSTLQGSNGIGWVQRKDFHWVGWWPSALGKQVAGECIKVTQPEGQVSGDRPYLSDQLHVLCKSHLPFMPWFPYLELSSDNEAYLSHEPWRLKEVTDANWKVFLS